MRKSCKECPWHVKNRHNDSWPNYVAKMTQIGHIENGKHVCHMIDSNTWGTVTDENVCIGSLKNTK